MAPENDPSPVAGRSGRVHHAASLFPASVTSRSYGRRRRVRRAVTAGVVLVALAGGGIAVAQTTGKTATSYRTVGVSTHDVTATIDGVATIQPTAQATVAFPMGGTVTSVDVKIGDTVTAGQTLGQLDTAAMLVTVRAKEAALDKANLVLASALAGDDVSSLTSGGSFGSSYAMSDAAVQRALAALPARVLAAGDDDGLAAAQQAVLDDQQAVDAAIDEAGSALTSATQVCAAISADPTSTDAGAVTAAVNACQIALDTVVTKQAAVQTAQNDLATASTALDTLLAQLAQQVTTPTTMPTSTAPTTTTPTTTTPTTTTPTTAPASTAPVTGESTPATSTTTPSSSSHASTTTSSTPVLDQPATGGQPSTGVTGPGGSGSGGAGPGSGSGGDQSSSTVPTDGAAGSTRSGSGGGTRSSGGSTSGATGATKKSPTAADLVAYQKAVDAAQSALSVAYLAVAQATIASPIDGQVIAVTIAPGDAVTAASTTATIIVQGTGGYEATTTVSLAKVASVQVGAAATVLPDGSPTAYAGKIVSVAIVPTTSTAGTSTFGVAIALDGDTSVLHNGGIGSVSIVTGTTTAAMTVPTSAVTTDGALHTVIVLDGSTPTTTLVQVGVVGPVCTEITSGLTAGQQVVLATVSKPLPSSATSATNGATTNRQITVGGRTFTVGAGGFGAAPGGAAAGARP